MVVDVLELVSTQASWFSFLVRIDKTRSECLRGLRGPLLACGVAFGDLRGAMARGGECLVESCLAGCQEMRGSLKLQIA